MPRFPKRYHNLDSSAGQQGLCRDPASMFPLNSLRM